MNEGLWAAIREYVIAEARLAELRAQPATFGNGAKPIPAQELHVSRCEIEVRRIIAALAAPACDSPVVAEEPVGEVVDIHEDSNGTHIDFEWTGSRAPLVGMRLFVRPVASTTGDHWRAILAALIDIYDDAYGNGPEDRCYVEGAYTKTLDECRDILKHTERSAPCPPIFYEEAMTALRALAITTPRAEEESDE